MDNEERFLKRFSLRKFTVPREKLNMKATLCSQIDKNASSDPPKKRVRVEYRELKSVVQTKVPYWLKAMGYDEFKTSELLVTLVEESENGTHSPSRLHAGLDRCQKSQKLCKVTSQGPKENCSGCGNGVQDVLTREIGKPLKGIRNCSSNGVSNQTTIPVERSTGSHKGSAISTCSKVNFHACDLACLDKRVQNLHQYLGNLLCGQKICNDPCSYRFIMERLEKIRESLSKFAEKMFSSPENDFVPSEEECFGQTTNVEMDLLKESCESSRKESEPIQREFCGCGAVQEKRRNDLGNFRNGVNQPKEKCQQKKAQKGHDLSLMEENQVKTSCPYNKLYEAEMEKFEKERNQFMHNCVEDCVCRKRRSIEAPSCRKEQRSTEPYSKTGPPNKIERWNEDDETLFKEEVKEKPCDLSEKSDKAKTAKTQLIKAEIQSRDSRTTDEILTDREYFKDYRHCWKQKDSRDCDPCSNINSTAINKEESPRRSIKKETSSGEQRYSDQFQKVEFHRKCGKRNEEDRNQAENDQPVVDTEEGIDNEDEILRRAMKIKSESIGSRQNINESCVNGESTMRYRKTKTTIEEIKMDEKTPEAKEVCQSEESQEEGIFEAEEIQNKENDLFNNGEIHCMDYCDCCICWNKRDNKESGLQGCISYIGSETEVNNQGINNFLENEQKEFRSFPKSKSCKEVKRENGEEESLMRENIKIEKCVDESDEELHSEEESQSFIRRACADNEEIKAERNFNETKRNEKKLVVTKDSLKPKDIQKRESKLENYEKSKGMEAEATFRNLYSTRCCIIEESRGRYSKNFMNTVVEMRQSKIDRREPLTKMEEDDENIEDCEMESRWNPDVECEEANLRNNSERILESTRARTLPEIDGKCLSDMRAKGFEKEIQQEESQSVYSEEKCESDEIDIGIQELRSGTILKNDKIINTKEISMDDEQKCDSMRKCCEVLDSEEIHYSERTESCESEDEETKNGVIDTSIKCCENVKMCKGSKEIQKQYEEEKCESIDAEGLIEDQEMENEVQGMCLERLKKVKCNPKAMSIEIYNTVRIKKIEKNENPNNMQTWQVGSNEDIVEDKRTDKNSGSKEVRENLDGQKCRAIRREKEVEKNRSFCFEGQEREKSGQTLLNVLSKENLQRRNERNSFVEPNLVLMPYEMFVKLNQNPVSALVSYNSSTGEIDTNVNQKSDCKDLYTCIPKIVYARCEMKKQSNSSNSASNMSLNVPIPSTNEYLISNNIQHEISDVSTSDEESKTPCMCNKNPIDEMIEPHFQFGNKHTSLHKSQLPILTVSSGNDDRVRNGMTLSVFIPKDNIRNFKVSNIKHF